MSFRFCLPILFFLFSSFISQATEEAQVAQELTQKVLWVPLNGTVELGLAPFLIRAIEYADNNKFDALVLEIDTFGGRVDAAVEIRDALLDAKTPTIAWINKRAISAGALIAFACDKIFFSPGSTMGAATPIQGGAEGAKDVDKKYVSYFRTEMGATAEQNGRPRKIAEAMVQATEEIKGYVKEGDVLTVTDRTALELKVSDGSYESKQALLKKLDLENASIEDFETNWAEQIVRFLTDPTVSGLLMSGGALGIILELQAPGFGLPGVIGISCLALFFFGKFLVNLAGWEEVLFLLIGIILIGVEIFVFPGTFVFAVAGFALLIGALFFAGISPSMPIDFSFPPIALHLQAMGTGLLIFLVGLALILWFFSKNPSRVPLGLEDHLRPGDGSSEKEIEKQHALIGRTGITLTDLKPTGKMEIESSIYNVSSSGEYINKGNEVLVVEIDGPRILVKEKK